MIEIFGHPFSSCTQKVTIALYETHTPFNFRMLDAEHSENETEFAKLAPLGKFPLLLDNELVIEETTIIIEYIAQHYAPEAGLIPANADDARRVRLFDRICDFYVMSTMQRIVADFMRQAEDRDPTGVAAEKAALDKAYSWLEKRLDAGKWAAGSTFTLADCAAAPALFYADWIHPIPDTFPMLKAYRTRLLARPSVMRAVDEARPYRHFFPPGAPDRD